MAARQTRAANQPAQPQPTGKGADLGMFENAPNAAPVTPTKSKKGKERQALDVEGLDDVAAFRVLGKVLEQESAGHEARVKENVISMYVDMLIDQGKKPESFLGIGEISSASCEIRKKASNVALSEDTVKLLKQRGIPVDSSVKVPARFIINPDLPQEALAQLANLVKNDPMLSKMAIVLKQPEESISTVSESSIDVLAKTGDRELIESLITEVATFAVGKFMLNGEGIETKVEGSDGEKQSVVTPTAKRSAIEILIRMGVIPMPQATQPRAKGANRGEARE